MKQPVRSFAIGLFTAGMVMLIGIYFFETRENNADQLSIDEMIPAIETEGYRVLTESEYISLSVNGGNDSEASNAMEKTEDTEEEPDENEDSEDETVKENNSEDEQAEEDSVTTYMLDIVPGMDSSDISSILDENEIIDDTESFIQYLNEHDYSMYIQIGEFELSDDMSFYEIAEKITN
ncbi:hypothetical protein [Virgibacillus ainsalahensis]